MTGTGSDDVRAEARLDKQTLGKKTWQLVRCGSKQSGTDHYWCDGVLGRIVEFKYPIPPCYEYPGPATAEARETNVQRARDAGLEVVMVGYRMAPPGYDGPLAENGLVAEPAIVRRSLCFPDGWRWRGWYWGRGDHAAAHATADWPCVTRHKKSAVRRGLSCLTPDIYPVVVECPSPACGLKQWLRADAEHLRLHVYGDDSDLPWSGEEERVFLDRPTREGGVVDPEWAARVYRRFYGAPASGERPERVALVALAQHTADCTTVHSDAWQELAEWARTASAEECQRCLDLATARRETEARGGVVTVASFAHAFLVQLGRRQA